MLYWHLHVYELFEDKMIKKYFEMEFISDNRKPILTNLLISYHFNLLPTTHYKFKNEVEGSVRNTL